MSCSLINALAISLGENLWLPDATSFSLAIFFFGGFFPFAFEVVRLLILASAVFWLESLCCSPCTITQCGLAFNIELKNSLPLHYVPIWQGKRSFGPRRDLNSRLFWMTIFQSFGIRLENELGEIRTHELIGKTLQML